MGWLPGSERRGLRPGSSCGPTRVFAGSRSWPPASGGRTWTTWSGSRRTPVDPGDGSRDDAGAGGDGRDGKAARRFGEFRYATLDSWSRTPRVIGKAEALPPTLAGGQPKENHRFIVTSLPARTHPARELYEQLYRARGDAENRAKRAQAAPVLGALPVQLVQGQHPALSPGDLRYDPAPKTARGAPRHPASGGQRRPGPAPPAEDRSPSPHRRTVRLPRHVLRLSRPGSVRDLWRMPNKQSGATDGEGS